MGSFIAVGIALLTIRDRRLYREGFKTFNAYCAEKWGIGRNYANRLITGAQVAANLSPRGDLCTPCEIQPTNEAQVRPLVILEPDQQCEVWEEAVRSADGKVVTFRQVQALVTELIGPAPEPNPPSASHSGFAYSGPPRRAPFTPPCFYPLGAPFAGRSGAVVALSAANLSFPGGGLGAHFRMAVLSAVEVSQEKGDGTPGRFLDTFCSGVSHAWSHTSGLAALIFKAYQIYLSKSDKLLSWQDIRYHSLSLKIAKYLLHQIIGLRAESMPPCEVIGLFLLAFHLLSLSVGATLGS